MLNESRVEWLLARSTPTACGDGKRLASGNVKSGNSNGVLRASARQLCRSESCLTFNGSIQDNQCQFKTGEEGVKLGWSGFAIVVAR
jgi:hypothetical protein